MIFALLLLIIFLLCTVHCNKILYTGKMGVCVCVFFFAVLVATLRYICTDTGKYEINFVYRYNI